MTSPSSAARSCLLEALTTFEPTSDGARVVVNRLGAALRNDGTASLADELIAAAGDDESREHLVDFIGHAARVLASDDAPLHPTDAWSTLVTVADSLNGSGVYTLGRPRFISDAFLRRLIDEAHAQLSAIGEVGSNRVVAPAGDALAKLAVSNQLRDAVTRALGFAVTTTYDALYEYDPAGSHVGVHVDGHGYEIVMHLLLEHAGGGPSVLTAHLPGATTPAHVELQVGEALILRGRGTIHSWRALGDDERRILTAIGFQRSRGDENGDTQRP